jgi:hypothetical protein
MRKSSINNSNDSEPVIVSSTASKTASNSDSDSESDRLTKLSIDKQTGGYKIIIDKENAQIFKKEVLNLKNSSNKKKHTVRADNAQHYINAAKNIKNALDALNNNKYVGSLYDQKKNLSELYKQFTQFGSDYKYYKLDNEIRCKVVINGNNYDAKIIGIDDGVAAIVKTSKEIYIIIIEGQLEISQKGGHKKGPSVFSSSSSIRSTSDMSSSSIESSSINMYSNDSNKHTSISSSSVQDSNKYNSPSTESMSTSSFQSKSESPYLNTSEYDIDQSDTPKKSNNIFRKPFHTDSSTKYTPSSELSINSSISSSNKSEYEDNQIGGFRKSNSSTNYTTDSDKSSIKFMRAGKGDNVGIIESTNSNYYYSESSSAIEGLCE